jgi:uncharacterized membrane protein YqjE
MKLFLLFFISLITSTAFTAQTPVLASVEITSSIAPPVEKNKVKKKRRQKKRFRKPNHSSQTKSKAARVRLIVVTCILFGLALLFLLFLVFGLAVSVEAIILSALMSIGLAIAGFVMLIISIIYNITDRNKEKKATSPLKKSTEELKAEVAYLNPEKVARYLALNEQLTADKIAHRNATAILKNKISTKKEKNKAKVDLSNLKQDIKIINQELKEFRQQNSIKQTRAERS